MLLRVVLGVIQPLRLCDNIPGQTNKLRAMWTSRQDTNNQQNYRFACNFA